MTQYSSSKRKFLKTAVYVAPAILTLKAIPSFASSGSGREEVPQSPGDSSSNNGNENVGVPMANSGNSGGVSYQAQAGYKKKKHSWYWPF